MKRSFLGSRGQVLIGLIVIVFGFIGGAGLTFVTIFHTAANSNHVLTASPGITPSPTPPQDNTIGLSASSGSPGTHLFLAATGFTPGEYVQPVWNYQGPGTGTLEKSYYYFAPVRAADTTGSTVESLFVPTGVAGNYTIAMVGQKSGVVKTAPFQVVPGLDPGVYIGPPGTVLRIIGWGFAKYDKVNLYWNWTSTNNGQQIGTVAANQKGQLGQSTFVVPAGTATGTYTVAAIGSISGILTPVQFTVGVPSLRGPPGPSDWSNFGFDLQSNRVNTTETTISPANVSSLAVKWKSPAPFPFKTVGTPIVANGIVYTGDVQGILTARDEATGKVLWTFYARAPIYGSPTVQNGIAYFGSVSYPFGGVVGNYVYALNATDGTLIWDNWLSYGAEWATPLVVNGRVFVPSALKEGVSGGFSAFDANTGATLWGFSTPYGIFAPDTMDPTGTNLYVGTANPCFTSPSPTVCAGYLLDLNPATGSIIWQIHFPDVSGDDDVPTAALYSNGRLYLGLKSGYFYCVDATNGNIIWQYKTGASGDFGVWSSATLYNNMVFFGGGDHVIYALNISDGSVAWSFTTGSVIYSSPSVANGVLYIGGVNKYIYALDPTKGTVLWSFKTGASVWSSPTISNGVLYLSGGDGYDYAFSPGGV